VSLCSSGDIMVVGTTDGSAFGSSTYLGGASDGFVAKLSHEGQVTWSRNYGSTGADIFSSVACDPAGAAIAVGSTNSAPAGSEGYQVLLNASLLLLAVWAVAV